MTPEDYQSIVRAEAGLHDQGWRSRFSLNEMMSAWHHLVAEIESGYDQVVHEYTNDLACRDWLALAWPMLTEHVRSVRQDELDALDARFRAATNEDSAGRLATFCSIDNDDGWWWRRLPSRRGGEFAVDFDTEGDPSGDGRRQHSGATAGGATLRCGG